MKPAYFFLIGLSFLYLLAVAGKEPIHNDETIYAASASFIKFGVDSNPEHPLLIKYIFSSFVSLTDAIEITKINNSNYYLGHSSQAIYNAVYAIRIGSALMLLALLTYVAVMFNDEKWFLITYSFMFLTNSFTTAMLDGWLVFLAMAFALVINKNKTWSIVLALFMPLVKIYSIAVGVFTLILHSSKSKQFLLLYFVMLFGFIIGYTNLGFALKHYSSTVSGGFLQTRYAYPFISVLSYRLLK